MLSKSISVHNRLLNENEFEFGKLKTLYIGGGTPSLWGEEGFNFLLNLLEKNNIFLENNVEFTIELNPGSYQKNELSKIKDLGVNRISVGVQSFSNEVLKLLDRVHNIDDVLITLENIKNLDFNFSVDFMLGLPKNGNIKRNIKNEVDQILKYNPNHLSAYILTVAKTYVHYNNLPDEDFTSDEYLLLAEYLKNFGYQHYEVSNFAKSGYESIHNLQYWHTNSVAALGPSATGFFNVGETGIRYKWKTNDLAEYSIEKISKAELKMEKFFLGIRLNLGINLLDFIEPKYSVEVSNFIDLLNKQGMVQRASLRNFSLSSKGFLCSDSIITKFLTYF